MSFLEGYEPVADRIAKFWADHKNGRIHTEIVLINEQEIVIKASVYTDREDARPASIDFAQETRGSSNINRQSFVENCSTSAIGRALATLGYAPKDASKRPSREEMSKAVKAAEKKQSPVTENKRAWTIELAMYEAKKDVEALRKLHKDAIEANADKDIIQQIVEAGKRLAE